MTIIHILTASRKFYEIQKYMTLTRHVYSAHIDVASLKPYWGKWAWPEVKLLIVGGLPGVALGAALYSVASPDLLRLLIGAVSVGFVFWQFSLARGWKASLGRARTARGRAPTARIVPG